MSSLFEPSPPPVQQVAAPPAEDPAVAEERRRQQFLAEQQRVASIQDNLRTQTELGSGNEFGTRSLLNFGLTPGAYRARARKSLLGAY